MFLHSISHGWHSWNCIEHCQKLLTCFSNLLRTILKEMKFKYYPFLQFWTDFFWHFCSFSTKNFTKLQKNGKTFVMLNKIVFHFFINFHIFHWEVPLSDSMIFHTLCKHGVQEKSTEKNQSLTWIPLLTFFLQVINPFFKYYIWLVDAKINKYDYWPEMIQV